MKVTMYKDAAYPVYGFSTHTEESFCTEVPEELIKQWQKVEAIYEFTQEQMKDAYERCIKKS